ncbi:hypothetical protein ASPBRDRAFT_354968 [Aspergillus brasiliensis CBS 101740]|uniref:Uncharacterized protein n=1 Tax=Aspergillus brasiliensis (strain CBS 101740 / IMI 381727 / IBT 21946) TaxID=767769 RepID=A0A1L9U5B4_ASPBC|nr:hypothetical protein ASPBRDRAFT_354968 [Aspergillus brasiliensis CBS 101740]
MKMRKRERERERKRERESRARESRAGSPSEGKACRATSRPSKRRPSHGSQPVTWLRHGCGCHAAIIMVVVLGEKATHVRSLFLARCMPIVLRLVSTLPKAACLPSSLQLTSLQLIHSSSSEVCLLLFILVLGGG